MTSDPGGDSGPQAGAEDSGAQDSGVEPEAEQAPEAVPQTGRRRAKHRKRSFWRDLVVIVVAALALTILLKAFVVQVFSIPTGSMEATLLPGDRILVSKIVYRFRPIARGDIVVFSGNGSWDAVTPGPGNWVVRIWDDAVNLVGIAGPQTDYVKRVIGIPGDHVVCCNAGGQITVNGVPLSEASYIFPNAAPSLVRFNITVPAGRLWVMGDDRGDSDDSRYRQADPGNGTIPESAVVGRAFLIIWPFSRVNDLPIPDTFKQAGLSAAAAVATAPPGVVGGGTSVAAGLALAWRRRRPGTRRPDRKP